MASSICAFCNIDPHFHRVLEERFGYDSLNGHLDNSGTAAHTMSRALQHLHAQHQSAVDEVDRYFAIMPDPNLDPLKFWKMQQSTLPVHCKLAMEVLCVMAASTVVERANSEAGREFSSDRMSLSSGMFVASMCVRSWLRDGGFKAPKDRYSSAVALSAQLKTDMKDMVDDEGCEGGGN